MNRNSNNYWGLLINYLIKKKFPFLVNEITAARGLNVLNNKYVHWLEGKLVENFKSKKRRQNFIDFHANIFNYFN